MEEDAVGVGGDSDTVIPLVGGVGSLEPVKLEEEEERRRRRSMGAGQ